jgi:hypothetical protein
VLMHKGTAALKLKSAFILAVISSPFAILTEGVLNWFKVNAGFILFVFGAVIIDHLVGSYVHAYIKRDFTLKKNIQGFFMKTALIVAVFFLGRGIVHILGDDDIVAVYFRTIMRLMVFLYPAGSALVNISIITKGKFPPIGMMKKISQFNTNLDLSEFKEKKNNNTNNTKKKKK